jgi:hypothetical protein
MFYHPMMGAIRASIIMFLFRVKDQRWHIRWALHVVCKDEMLSNVSHLLH